MIEMMRTFLASLFFLYTGLHLQAQALAVANAQGINFGTFYQLADAGGAITLTNQGVRSASGDVSLLQSDYYYAVFTVSTTEAGPVTVVVDQPEIILYGSNGGTMRLQIGPSRQTSTQLTSTSPADICVGGTLSVGSRASNPPGVYSGEGIITFIINNP